jgi:asparagine synthase (glutamine-hydrolysing)
MCGLCLSVNDTTVDIRRLTQRIKHRGPDSTGFYIDSHIACGFNRLAIVDSDPLSDQPMLDAARRYLLVFNGEIYNHNKLRSGLQARYQIRFATRSDTEVLLNGLIAEGADFIDRLDGIYAFAFVDLETLEVLLARDVFGVKPLYYFSRDDRLYVSSEIKPLRAISGNGLNVASMARYLSCGIAGDSDAVVSGVHEVSPNTIIRFRRGQAAESAKIHNLRFDGHDTAGIDEIRDALHGAIESQKPTMPYGVLFSGGIDSTLVLEQCLRDSHFAGAYSLDVNHPDMSERVWQEYVIDKNQMRDRYIRVELNKKDFSVANMADVARELDYPPFHPNFIGSFMLTRAAAKDGLKVLLSGEGADELFLGYRWFFSNDRASDFLEYVPLQDLQSLLGAQPNPAQAPDTTLLETFQRVYLRRWLLRQDLTGMANSVEIRVPFLGADIAQLANRLAVEFKKRHGSKWLLKSLLANKYPSEFLERKKMGFDFPLNDWIGAEHCHFLRQRTDLFDATKLQTILQKHEGSFMKNRIVFSLVALAHWLEA